MPGRTTRRSGLLGCLSACLVVLASGPAVSARTGAAAGTPTASANDPSFDDRLEAAFAELDRSGVSALVAVSPSDGPTVYGEFGALRDDGVPARSTQVDLNSVTKTVTGVMVLRLVEQGRVRLDETLRDVFAGVPEDKAAITVHHLLTHSAGFAAAIGDDGERLGRDAFLRRAFASGLLSAPGARYNYSNVGYAVLAAVIEERSGHPFDAYLRTDVLARDGLSDTGYTGAYDEDRSIRSADGLPIMAASWGGHEPYWNLIGNGGLVSTAEDFVQFRRAVAAGRIVSPASVALLQTPHVPEDETGETHYGYGLVVQAVPDLGRVYWHDGGNDVFSAIWVELADRGDLVFVAAVDSPAGDAFSAVAVLQEHLYGAAAV